MKGVRCSEINRASVNGAESIHTPTHTSRNAWQQQQFSGDLQGNIPQPKLMQCKDLGDYDKLYAL